MGGPGLLGAAHAGRTRARRVARIRRPSAPADGRGRSQLLRAGAARRPAPVCGPVAPGLPLLLQGARLGGVRRRAAPALRPARAQPRLPVRGAVRRRAARAGRGRVPGARRPVRHRVRPAPPRARRVGPRVRGTARCHARRTAAGVRLRGGGADPGVDDARVRPRPRAPRRRARVQLLERHADAGPPGRDASGGAAALRRGAPAVAAGHLVRGPARALQAVRPHRRPRSRDAVRGRRHPGARRQGRATGLRPREQQGGGLGTTDERLSGAAASDATAAPRGSR